MKLAIRQLKLLPTNSLICGGKNWKRGSHVPLSMECFKIPVDTGGVVWIQG